MKKPNLNTVVTKFRAIANGEETPNTLYIVGFVFILGLTAFLIQFHKPTEAAMEKAIDLPTLDTFVPAGMALVSIRLENYEYLDQSIGKFGVVDLYTVPLSPLEKPRTVAKRVKVVRSSKSPQHFSVLVKETDIAKITGAHQEFTAIVRNPNSFGTKFVNKKNRPNSRKVFYDMEIR